MSMLPSTNTFTFLTTGIHVHMV